MATDCYLAKIYVWTQLVRHFWKTEVMECLFVSEFSFLCNRYIRPFVLMKVLHILLEICVHKIHFVFHNHRKHYNLSVKVITKLMINIETEMSKLNTPTGKTSKQYSTQFHLESDTLSINTIYLVYEKENL